MAKNELSVSGGEGDVGAKYLALRPDSDIRAALTANLCPGETLKASDLPRVPTPSGGGRVWTWIDSGNNEQTAKSIDGILVYYGVRGTLWGSEEPQGKASPVLVSYDLIRGYRVNDDIGDLDAAALEACRTGDREYDWQRLPWNQYGSGKGGHGRRCKEARLLAILRKDEAWPLLVTAGPGSLKTVVPFVKRLPVAHFQAEVSLTLERVESSGGQPYSQIVPRLLGTISKEYGEIVRRMYTAPLAQASSKFDEVE